MALGRGFGLPTLQVVEEPPLPCWCAPERFAHIVSGVHAIIFLSKRLLRDGREAVPPKQALYGG